MWLKYWEKASFFFCQTAVSKEKKTSLFEQITTLCYAVSGEESLAKAPHRK